MGAKREEVLTGKEKSMTAYHEAGHALLAWLVPGIDRCTRSRSFPAAAPWAPRSSCPRKTASTSARASCTTRLLFLLGGRAAEKLVFDEFSAGAEDDLNQATQIARRMVTHWGMSERLGPVAFRDGEEHPFLGKEMAEPRRVQRAHRPGDRRGGDRASSATAVGAGPRDARPSTATSSTLLADALEQEETLDERAIEELIGPARPADGQGRQ